MDNILTVQEILQRQQKLQEKYEGIWAPVCPQQGRSALLWMMAEAGEAAQVIKKQGEARIMVDEAVRARLIEELADVVMYLGDVLLCYGISAQEFSNAYREKSDYNMVRIWPGQTPKKEETP